MTVVRTITPPVTIKPRLSLGRIVFNSLFLIGAEFLAIVISIWLAFAGYAWLGGATNTIPKMAAISLPIWLASAWLSGLYPGFGLGPIEEVRRVTRAIGITFLLTTAVLYFANNGPIWARFVLLFGSIFCWFFVLAARSLVRKLLIRFGLWGLPVAIIGAAQTGKLLARSLLSAKSYGFNPITFYDDDLAKQGHQIEGLSIRGPIAQIANDRFSVAFIAITSLPREALSALLQGPLANTPKVYIVPDFFGIESLWVEARDIGGILTLELRRNLLKPGTQLFKRFLDIVLSSFIVIFALPLFLIIALAIKIDSKGPIIFKHKRLGREKKEFMAFKFRTMHYDAEKTLFNYLENHPELKEEWEKDQKLRNDPRITRIGKFLRRSSLDELPQLFNVLFGHMSLVGPRPIIRQELIKYGQDANLLHQVLPGLTGLWQVSGRNEVSFEQRKKLDSYYIRNWSVWLDIVIILRTIPAVLFGKGAY